MNTLGNQPQPYQPPAPPLRSPGPGSLIGGIIAIIATGIGLAVVAGILLPGAHISDTMVTWIARAFPVVVLTAIGLYLRRWLRLRKPGATRASRRELPALLIFALAVAGMAVVAVLTAIASH